MRSGAHVRIPLYFPIFSFFHYLVRIRRARASLAECDFPASPRRSLIALFLRQREHSLTWLSMLYTCSSSLSVLFPCIQAVPHRRCSSTKGGLPLSRPESLLFPLHIAVIANDLRDDATPHGCPAGGCWYLLVAQFPTLRGEV